MAAVAPNMMLSFHPTNRGLVHIQSPVQQIPQCRTRNHSKVYHSEFKVVEPFEGHRWVTNASVQATNRLLNAPTAIEANLFQCSHIPPPHITGRTWQDCETFIEASNVRHMGFLYDAILGPLLVRHWRFNEMCNLLLDETPTYTPQQMVRYVKISKVQVQDGYSGQWPMTRIFAPQLVTQQ